MDASLTIALCVTFCASDAAVVLNDITGTLVYPRLLEGRTVDGQRILKVTDDLTLNLSPSTVFAKSFVLRNYLEDGTAREQQLKASDFEKHLYHDERHMASVTVKDGGGGLQVEGVLGLNRRIRPAPELERSGNGQAAHLLYEVDEVPWDKNFVRAVYPDVRVEERQQRQTRGQQTHALPDVIYPEICVVSDSAHARGFKNGMASAVEYMGIFINAVNMRYRSVYGPDVRLRIVAIHLSSPAEESYFDRPRGHEKYLFGMNTLYNFALVVSKDPKYKRCDIVYLMTGLDMASNDGGRLNTGLRGLAYVGQACTFFREGLGEDTARKFAGIHVMTHEVAHILGCPHDGKEGPPNMRGAPGSKMCSWNDGYIMSYLVINLNHFKFSRCCNEMITFSARSTYQRCLLEINAGDKETIWRDKLPGELNITLDKQCRWNLPHVPETRVVGDGVQNKDCKAWCFLPPRIYGYETSQRIILLDGTPCRGGKGICYNGQCRKNRPVLGERSGGDAQLSWSLDKIEIN